MDDPVDTSAEAEDTSLDGMMQHLEDAKQRDNSNARSSKQRRRWSGLQRKVRQQQNVAILSKNYTDRLDELVEREAITHRSGSTLRSAEAAFDAHGRLPIYYRTGDTVTHTGLITALAIDPDPDSDEADAFRKQISADDTYGEYNDELDETTYIVEHGRELEDTFPMTELRKVSNNEPIDEGFWRSPAYVFHRDGDFSYTK